MKVESDEGEMIPLPSLEDLVKRIPPGALAAMDEHFRAKWAGVRRVKAADLKN